MDTLTQDVRYAVRQLRASPGFTLVAVLTLGLGIGANTAIFSVVNAVLLTPLPYAEPERLVTLKHHYPSLNDMKAPVSPLGYRIYTERARSFESLAAENWWWGANLTGGGEPERVQGRLVTGEFFRTLGVGAALGRALTADDADRDERVVVLADGLWRRRFGADPAIVGRSVQLNGEAYEVVGVMPPSFRDFFGSDVELWAPLAFTPEQLQSGVEFLAVIGRRGPGVTQEAAAAEMASIAEQIKQEFPGALPDNWNILVTPLDELATGELRTPLLVLLGAVGFVLLIACANIANLLLARAAGRIREIAVRRALGAAHRQLIAQFLTESLLLALAGGVLGLVIAAWGTDVLRAFAPDAGLGGVGERPFVIDWRVLAFTAAAAVGTGVLFGLAPALQAAKADVQSGLREGGRGLHAERSGRTLRRALVVAEIALALTLLTGAGLLIKSFQRLQQVDPGFRPEGLLTFHLPLPRSKYQDARATGAFFDRALERIEAVPGVERVSATHVLPFAQGGEYRTFNIEGYVPAEGEPNPWGEFHAVTPDFPRAMGIPLLEGRFFDERDRAGAPPVAVIDEELARRYFAGSSPIGRRVYFGPRTEATMIEIVGVIGHTKKEGLAAEDLVQLYVPYRQVPVAIDMWVVVRTSGDPEAALPAVRRAIQEIDPNQPLAQVRTMDQRISASVSDRRLSTGLLALFAGLALLLAVIGIYGVMSHLVTQRTHEIGLRMALGAERHRILALFVGHGIRLTAFGAALGVVGAWALTRLLRSQLYDVAATDPATFGVTALLLVVVALAASWLPARRAARVDPMVALRTE